LIVCETDGKIAGYAYAAQHRERAAYAYDVSIYVSPEYQGYDIGSKLYGRLFDILERLNFVNVYAASSAENSKGIKFHEKFGFAVVGTHRKTGYKFGKWIDVIWLQKRSANTATILPSLCR